MTEDKLRELRNDLLLWIHFVLSDADFLAAMQEAYGKDVLDREIAEVLAIIRKWVHDKIEP